MKRPITEENPNSRGSKFDGLGSIDQKKMMIKKKKKNMMRMGGGGLSLEAFANAKTKTNEYNPALIKKQREFYKNAKYVGKYKKSLKQQRQQNDPFLPMRSLEDENETERAGEMNQNYKKNNRRSAQSLREVYEQKHEEEEKAKMERDAIVQAKKEERERTESRRKAVREKMLKKTRSGQPVMKYRIEHLLETIQGSTS